MPQGKETPPELCWTVVRMAAYGVSPAKISLYTNLCKKNIDEIQHHFNTTGDAAVQRKRRDSTGTKGRMGKEVLGVCNHALYKLQGLSSVF